ATFLPPRERRRCQVARHPSREHDAPADGCGRTQGGRRRRGAHPPLGRARGCERHHGRPRPGAQGLAKELSAMELGRDGGTVFAATGGAAFEPKRPVVVFLHGAGMDHSVWTLQARYFAHHGRSVLALDLPGHGRSHGPQPASIEAYADWLAALIAAAGVERAALVGHSMGALITLETAARAPQRVRALALLGVAARMPVHPDLLAAADRGDPAAIELITAWAYGKPAHLGGHKAPGLWMLGGGRRLLERSRAGVLANDLR